MAIGDMTPIINNNAEKFVYSYYVTLQVNATSIVELV